MRKLWLMAVVAASVGLTGCASKGWVTEQLNQTRSQIATQIQQTERRVNQALKRVESKANANQAALSQIQGEQEKQVRLIKALDAKVTASVTGTRELLIKERELLRQRLTHIDMMLGKIGGRPLPKKGAGMPPRRAPKGASGPRIK